MKTSLLIGMCLFSCIVKGQINYYVSPIGVDNATNGSFASPWLTIQYGLNHLSGGDTLNIKSGTYTEKINVPISGITLRNYSTDQVVIDANGITSQTAIVKISSKSNVTVKGLELKNSIMHDAQGILVDGSSQHVTLSNCIVHDIHFSSNAGAVVNSNTNAQGIIVYGSNATTAISNLKIINNELYNCRLGYSEGIAVNGNVDGFEVSGNNVHDLTNIGIDVIGHEGTSSNASNDQARNGVVKNNVVHHCLSAYATSGGLYVDGGKSIVIENNTSYHNGYGIEVGCENVGTTTDAITIRNNVFYDNEVCAIALGGYNYPGGSGKVINAVVRNNTCYANDYSHSGNGELYLSYSENSIIENNIFYTSTDNNLAYAELGQPNLQFNYNIFYCAAGAASFSVDWNGSNYSSYNAFTSGTSSNANSSFANPLWGSVVIASPDFHVGPSSPAINKGNPSYSSATGEVDLDQQARSNGVVDCGADEYYVVTGLEQAASSSDKILVYPNPANDTVTIAGQAISLKQITVYNNYGQVIAERIVNPGEDVLWNVSFYPKGLYQVVAIDATGNRWTQKIVVQ
ncbi:MAG: polysaccharide lyase [Chitinophagaceae bacterium]|nr:polysaccharide lyase [Chitinophagaceae bacterium]